MTNIINLTPHPLRLRGEVSDTSPEAREADIVILPFLGANGKPAPARVSTTPGGVVGDANGITIYGAPTWGAVEGLPAPAPDTMYIVSGMVAGRVTGRLDVVCPGTGPSDAPVRTAAGQIFAVTRLNQAG